jgi:hypothetical protein
MAEAKQLMIWDLAVSLDSGGGRFYSSLYCGNIGSLNTGTTTSYLIRSAKY